MALRQAAFADLHGEKGDVIERRYGSNCKCRFQNYVTQQQKPSFPYIKCKTAFLILF